MNHEVFVTQVRMVDRTSLMRGGRTRDAMAEEGGMVRLELEVVLCEHDRAQCS